MLFSAQAFTPSSTLRLAGRDVRTLLQFLGFLTSPDVSCESKTTLINDLLLYPCKSFQGRGVMLIAGRFYKSSHVKSCQFHVKFLLSHAKSS